MLFYSNKMVNKKYRYFLLESEKYQIPFLTKCFIDNIKETLTQGAL